MIWARSMQIKAPVSYTHLDVYKRQTHDYTRKGGVVHTEIRLPPHAPPSFADRSTLWNSVELYEKAGNAQLAREIDAALPIELSREEHWIPASSFVWSEVILLMSSIL